MFARLVQAGKTEFRRSVGRYLATSADAAKVATEASQRKRSRWGLKILGGVAAVAATGFGVLQLESYEGTRRTAYFWLGTVPLVLHYRYAQWKIGRLQLSPEEADKIYDDLHEVYAPRMKRLIIRLGGAYTKVGQVMVSRADVTPQRYIDELGFLLDDMQPRPVDEVISVLREDLGDRKFEEVFSSFDALPIGVASLAQVHKAVLADGRPVVAKVQYKNAYRLLMTDIDTINRFIFWMYPEMKELGEEILEQFRTELDFQNEFDNLKLMKEKFKHIKGIVIPEPIMATPRAVIMSYLPGISIFRDLREQRRPPMETFRSIATMIGAMGHQILVEGVFNGDPHPGNFLVMPDGKLGLIDFGQVKVLDDDIRLAFARLVKALANDDEDGIVQSALDMGLVVESVDKKNMVKLARLSIDTYRFETDSPFQEYDDVLKNNKVVHFPRNFVFVSRACQLLRGFTYNIPGISMAKLWEPYADEALGLRKNVDIDASLDVVKRAYMGNYTLYIGGAAAATLLAAAATVTAFALRKND